MRLSWISTAVKLSALLHTAQHPEQSACAARNATSTCLSLRMVSGLLMYVHACRATFVGVRASRQRLSTGLQST